MARKLKIKIYLPRNGKEKKKSIWIPSIPIYIFQFSVYLAIKFEDHLNIDIPYLDKIDKRLSKKDKLDLSKNFFKELKETIKPIKAFELLRLQQKDGMELIIKIK